MWRWIDLADPGRSTAAIYEKGDITTNRHALRAGAYVILLDTEHLLVYRSRDGSGLMAWIDMNWVKDHA